MDTNFGLKAMEIARRFYLNPNHHGTKEFTTGGYLRMNHKNLGRIQGVILGFDQEEWGNEYCFNLNLPEGDNVQMLLNNYGFYSADGNGDKLGLLLLSTATEREEIDFGTVRKQNHFPQYGAFCLLNLNYEEFQVILEDMGKMELAWLVNREPFKALFQLHDPVMIQFTATNPNVGDFSAVMYCPGYELQLHYNHQEYTLSTKIAGVVEQLHWSDF